MDRKKAGLFFLGTCVLLAILLLARVLTPVVSGAIFAVALLVYGIASRGFRKMQ